MDTAEKERITNRLHELEQLDRAGARQKRADGDEQGALVLRARADAFALSRDLVEGKAY